MVVTNPTASPVGSHDVEAVAADARAHVQDAVDQLCHYLRVPAISCLPEHAGDVRKLCDIVRDDLEAAGFDRCRVLDAPGAQPLVAAEWLHAGADRPTVLIYGHLDLQPVEVENWRSPPHEPVVRNGRLYARGSADDMGGWVSHMAAIASWTRVAGGPPCNIKLIIEGEEEIGSPGLERFMDLHPQAFEADVMVLTDCENPSTEVPGLTVSLRGLIEVEIRCSALAADVHSGLWGGMAPDPALALCMLIARIVDDNGRLRVGRRELSAEDIQRAREVPFDAETVRRGTHMIDGVEPLPEAEFPAAAWLWRQPSVTVLSTTLPQPGKEKNAIRKGASAKLSVRLAPDQQADEMYEALHAELARNPPCGVKVEVEQVACFGEGWLYTPKGPAFAAADRAYEKSWGHRLARVGVGGSIPFVALFGRRFGDLPLILNGVMDPETTAHGPNESMHLGVFEKAILANVYLLDELAALGSELKRG